MAATTLAMEVVIEPEAKVDQEKLASVLQDLAQRDPTFGIAVDAQSGGISIKGIDELHLETVIGRIRHESNVRIKVGEPQIAYLETIRKPATIDYTHKKRSGDLIQFARVVLEFKPAACGKAPEFVDNTPKGAIPEEYLGSIKDGVEASLCRGIVAGYPLVNIRVTLSDCTFDAGSTAEYFGIAARMACREGLLKANPILLEPIMAVGVTTPENYADVIRNDLVRRRGIIEKQCLSEDSLVINAMVPLSRLFGYANSLRFMTQAEARYTSRFNHYDEVPFENGAPDPDFPAAAALRTA